MKTPITLMLAVLALAIAPGVQAKSSDRNQDMLIDAGRQSGNTLSDGKTVLSDGVIITQGTLDLRSASAEIFMKDGEPVRAVFSGKQATMKQQMDDGSWMDAKADKIDYDIPGEVITLIGNYTIKSDRGTQSGQRMVYNTRSGDMQSGGDGSRVRTVIAPKNKAPAADASKPAQPSKPAQQGSRK